MNKNKFFPRAVSTFRLWIYTLLGYDVSCLYETTARKKYSLNDSVFWDHHNNGLPKESDEVSRLISCVPSKNQYAHSKTDFYCFIHFGMNTMTGKEWGDGKESPDLFNPKTLSCEQWVKAIKNSGAKGIIFTAKHHDGFCLWQTDTTSHSIKNSPYKNGKGDIVRELSAACKKYNVKFGIYLSPWDRHEPTYGTAAYNDFYVRQLTELCANYGELFSLWFDGACGVKTDKGFCYDWERITQTVRTFQPNAVLCVCGPDVRWVGNESGLARPSEWSVVPLENILPSDVAERSQKSEQDTQKIRDSYRLQQRDNGNRKIVFEKEITWAQAECDVSIRKGWFYHKKESPKPLRDLLTIYFNSVGRNASLLLNVPPNSDGLIDTKDIRRLHEFGNALSDLYSKPISYAAFIGNNHSTRQCDSLHDAFREDDYLLDFRFDSLQKIRLISISEDIRHSQRIERFSVFLIRPDKTFTLVSNGTVVGVKKLIHLNPRKNNDAVGIRIMITQSRSIPVIESVGFYS